MLNLVYPIRQSIALSNTMLRLYNRAKRSQYKQVMFDLSKTKSITPFGIIVLTSTIAECVQGNKECMLERPQNKKCRDYLNNIGFYEFFKLSHPNCAESIATTTVQLKRVKGIDYQLVDQIITVFDSNLNLSPGVKGSLGMSIRETMTNVISHSGVQDYFVCAWTYPGQKQIRLCITDLGKGILKSLRSSSKYKDLTNDYEAIKKATEEGVSARKETAGYGLTHIKKFLKVNGGQLCIISGNGKVFWKFDQGKILEQTMKKPFRGTIVKLVINIDKEGYYQLASEVEDLI